MSELRYNVICHEWVVIASERAKRPQEFSSKQPWSHGGEEYSSTCPFCPGNDRPDEVITLSMPAEGLWQTRVVLNKYPALSPNGHYGSMDVGFQRSVGGFGTHEVIVENRHHGKTMATMSKEELQLILETYRFRYRKLRMDNRLRSIVIFKNHGPEAGTSLIHPHSQIVATPIVPNRTRSRLEESARFFDATGQCLFCRTVDEELADGRRILIENEHFVAFVPYAALSPFHIWIFPKRHEASFGDVELSELPSLAQTLRDVMRRIDLGLGDPSFNLTILSIPLNARDKSAFHWYVSIVPRVSKIAGFELGCGMHINPAIPEESAKFLQSVSID